MQKDKSISETDEILIEKPETTVMSESERMAVRFDDQSEQRQNLALEALEDKVFTIEEALNALVLQQQNASSEVSSIEKLTAAESDDEARDYCDVRKRKNGSPI